MMYAANAGAGPEIVSSMWALCQLTVFCQLVGWVAERVLDTGLRARFVPLLCGVAGLWAGSWLSGLESVGPVLAGQPILPACAGALAISTLFKLVGLAAASGPRW